jgi:hypothetical protein
MKGMRKYIVVAIIAIGALLGGGGLAIHGIHNKKPVSSPAAAPVQAPATNYLTYQGVSGKTALELLQAHAKVEIKNDPQYGAEVIGINGTRQGNNKYWSFYVNGKMAQVGAGSYHATSGDKIEWKLQ